MKSLVARRASTITGSVLGALAVSLFASAADAGGAPPYFQDVEDAFPGQGCAGEGCWTNYLRLSDVDDDGDLDAIFPNASGFFSSPGDQPLEIYLNDGDGTFALGTATLLGSTVSGAYRVVAIGDVNGDGRRDVFLPSAAGDPDQLFIQDAAGDFTDEAATRIGTASRSAAVRFGDVDADGDLDLLIGAGYATSDSPPARLYLNDGDGVFTVADGALPATLNGGASDPDDVDFIDVDGDFDVDILVNVHSGKDSLWINDGSGVFSDESDRIPGPQGAGAFHYGPTACDIDGDGDRDILIDNIGVSYGEQVLVNDGTGNFTADNARLGGNPADSDDNGLVCLDFDDDGDMDVIVMALSTAGERLFENDGTGHFTGVGNGFTALFDPTLWMEAGDVNGDGRLDVITAQGEGSPQIERLYLGGTDVAVDVTGPVVFASDDDTFWPEVRFALRDAATSDEGPRVEGVAAVIQGRDAPIPATFMGGDLYRVVVPDGTTTFELCATDLAGNEGCTTITHEGEVTGSGGSGGAGSGTGTGGGTGTGSGGGGAPSTSSLVASSASSGPSTSAAFASAASSTATGGDGGADGSSSSGDDRAILDDDGGCGCEVVGAPSPRPLAALAGLALAGATVRRRRTRGRG